MINTFLLSFMFLVTVIVANPVKEGEELNLLTWNGFNEQVGTIPIPLKRGKFFEGLIIGTYWCGSGNVAEHNYDLGENWEVDLCCRDHDHCKYSIESNEIKNGIRNDRPFTAVTCECDWKFYGCLLQTNKYPSDQVLFGYSLTNPQCFDRRQRITCQTLSLGDRCTSYRLDDVYVYEWKNSSFIGYAEKHSPTKQPPATFENPDVGVVLGYNQQNRLIPNKSWFQPIPPPAQPYCCIEEAQIYYPSP